ncbi:DNA primase [termite gut metagenome]|uniref:DNA primase n=1 Tax=termite gut metagenome TaxID=433724 RepID=A0A5J4QFK5_9ZZZZ
MDSKIINRFPIRDYLAGSGIHPAKDNGYYGMYHSPFREDPDASLKVDYSKNLWIDYGTGGGGTLIDLVMRMENCSNGKAMQLLQQRIAGSASFSFHREKELEKQEPSISIEKISALANPGLLSYLSQRCINTRIARLHCQEVHYNVKGNTYFALGFRNDAGGYELRNKYFKGCTSKEITSIRTASQVGNTCQLFEGFMDYLSFLTLKNWQYSQTDVIILNSLANLPKVSNRLTNYGNVSSFLDNDAAGKKAVQELRSFCKQVNDQSVFYATDKDLNEYLCGKKQVQEKRQSRGMKR